MSSRLLCCCPAGQSLPVCTRCLLVKKKNNKLGVRKQPFIVKYFANWEQDEEFPVGSDWRWESLVCGGQRYRDGCTSSNKKKPKKTATFSCLNGQSTSSSSSNSKAAFYHSDHHKLHKAHSINAALSPKVLKRAVVVCLSEDLV